MEQLLQRCCSFICTWGWIAKKDRFVQYTPTKCLNNFVQFAVNAGREGDENPKSSVAAETMKLLANSSSSHQILDWIRHTVTKYLSNEKTHEASITKCLNVWVF